MSIPKFSNVTHSFHTVLKERISNYFETKGKASSGNFSLYMKAAILITLLAAIYTHLVFFTPPAIWALLECILLACVVSAIGFNVMHDGAHGSFSKSKIINRAAALTLNLLGGNAFMWNMKHNIVHHAYTNVDGLDDDINVQPWMRMSETQKKYKLHKYQHLYFWFFYSLLYIAWIFIMDYKKYFGVKIGEVPLKKMKLSDHFTFWGFKLLNAFLFVGLPIYRLGFMDWMIGFLVFTTIAGFVLSIVFQLAHTVEHTAFPVPNVETGKLDDEWAIHQIRTTANFATKNKVVSWLVGGLNFQIEHHLFPKISHVHYPAISKIIRQACQEYGIPYLEYPRVRLAVASHVAFLRKMGR